MILSQIGQLFEVVKRLTAECRMYIVVHKTILYYWVHHKNKIDVVIDKCIRTVMNASEICIIAHYGFGFIVVKMQTR